MEIERKYLVKDLSFKQEAIAKKLISQAYPCTDKGGLTIRLRCIEDQAFITIKSPTPHSSCAREEWEYKIPKEEANEMMRYMKKNIIFKTRYIVPYKGKIWEVDCFHLALEGLVLAEIELKSEDELFFTPPWLGEEVSFDERYYNAYLCGLSRAEAIEKRIINTL